MTYALFEENGDLKAGTVMADNGSSLQVELVTGRRAKIKAGHVMLRFEQPAARELLPAAQALSEDIDLDFLWECAPQDEFDFAELAREYYGAQAATVEQSALLLRLQSAPIYFQRKGRGRFRPATPETLRMALAAVARRREQELRVEQYAAELTAGRVPESMQGNPAQLLFRPDKNGVEFRALERAAQELRVAPERLLVSVGAFASPRTLHVERFTAEYFPDGLGFEPAVVDTFAESGQELEQLPLSEARTFSIDDSTTTEIDDCLSVQRLGDGTLRVGVHIAAPGLAIAHGSPLDLAARERMSTVYMPGDKITMLPEEVIAAFSLEAGSVVPAVSIYLDLNHDGTRIVSRFSRSERIMVADNLRHDQLSELITEAALESESAELPHGEALRALWKLTLALCAERERVRGKPEPRFRNDFSFYIDDEQVRIEPRGRNAPLDRIVAEMMILANSEWGQLLADHRVPGIYRSQQGGRVRMSTHALPHQGIGVAQYMWTTSPLRRYVDLVNQRQILALLAGENPPFAPQDAELFGVMSAFEARYAAYSEFQQRMERYWCLRWLEQRQATRVEAVAIRDDLVRIKDAPMYFRPTGLPAVAPGRAVMVDLLAHDLVDLSLEARFVELASPADDEAQVLAALEGVDGDIPGLDLPIPDSESAGEPLEEVAGQTPAAELAQGRDQLP
jgi:exoribonuclease-2